MDKLKEKIKGTHGITLIALVITIVILVILSGVAISTLTGENGFINKVKQAQGEQEKAEAREVLVQKIYELQIKIADEENRMATLGDFKNLIDEDVDLTFISASYKTASTEPVEGDFNTIDVLYKKFVFTIDDKLEITNIVLNTETAEVEFSYEVKNKKEENGKIIYDVIINLVSQQKILKVEHETDILYAKSGTEKISLDAQIEKCKEYTYIITTKDGRKVEKSFEINQVLITDFKVTEQLNIGVGKNKNIKVKEALPSYADFGKLTYTSSDENIVVVDADGNVTGISKGNAKVIVKEEHSKLEAVCNICVIENQLLTSNISNITASYTYSDYYPTYAFDQKYGEYGVECNAQETWSTYSSRKC